MWFAEKGEETSLTNLIKHRALTITGTFSPPVFMLTLELDDFFSREATGVSFVYLLARVLPVLCSSGRNAQSQVLWTYEPVLLGGLHPKVLQ